MKRWTGAAILTLLCVIAANVFLSLSKEPAPDAIPPRLTEMGLLLLDGDNGLYVLGVMNGSLAGDVGIRPGDYLTCAQGTALTSASQLEELLADLTEADSVSITLERQRQMMTVDLALR